MTGWSRRRVLRTALSTAALGSLPIAQFARAAEPPFRRGVNAWPWFSLTREFPAPRTDYGWPPFQPQRPVPTAHDLRRLRDTGLDFIRLPVDPGPFLAADAGRLGSAPAVATGRAASHSRCGVPEIRASARTTARR